MDKKQEFFRFIRFGIVGVLNTLVDAGLFWLIISITPLDKNMAKTISFFIAVANSYIFNKRWTFKDNSQADVAQVTKFVLVNVASFFVSLLVLNLASSVLKLDIAYPLKVLGVAPIGKAYDDLNLSLINLIIVTPFVLVVNFIGNRIFVFKGAK